MVHDKYPSFKYCSFSQEPLGELLLYERTFHHRDTDMLQRAAQSLTSYYQVYGFGVVLHHVGST